MSTVEKTAEPEELSPEDRLAVVQERTNKDGTLTAEVHEIAASDNGSIRYTFIHAGQTYRKVYDEPTTLGDESKHIDICNYLDMPLYSFDAIEGSSVPMVKKGDSIEVDMDKVKEPTTREKIMSMFSFDREMLYYLPALLFPVAAITALLSAYFSNNDGVVNGDGFSIFALGIIIHIVGVFIPLVIPPEGNPIGGFIILYVALSAVAGLAYTAMFDTIFDD